MKVNKTAVILISFFMLLGISFLGYYYTTMKQHPRRLPTYGNPGHKVGSFSFLNQDPLIYLIIKCLLHTTQTISIHIRFIHLFRFLD